MFNFLWEDKSFEMRPAGLETSSKKNLMKITSRGQDENKIKICFEEQHK